MAPLGYTCVDSAGDAAGVAPVTRALAIVKHNLGLVSASAGGSPAVAWCCCYSSLASSWACFFFLQRLFFPTVHAKFSLVANQALWQKPTFDFLESVVSQIEARFGRLNPTVLKSKEMFDRDPQHIRRTIYNGPHHRFVAAKLNHSD